MNNSSTIHLVPSQIDTNNTDNKENVSVPFVENKIKRFIKENIWLCSALLGVAVGLIMGLILRKFNMNPLQRKYFLFPGEVFLRMFKFVLLPLITSSLITGIGKLNLNTNRRIVSLSFGYFCLTTIIASILGKFWSYLSFLILIITNFL